MLAERAPGSRIERLRAIVSLSNAAMLHLLAPYGWVLAEPTDECAVACLEISATGGMPGWPAGAAGRRVLVEQRGWFETPQVAQLRADGNDVRQCQGPAHRAGLPARSSAPGTAAWLRKRTSSSPCCLATPRSARPCWTPTGSAGRAAWVPDRRAWHPGPGLFARCPRESAWILVWVAAVR